MSDERRDTDDDCVLFAGVAEEVLSKDEGGADVGFEGRPEIGERCVADGAFVGEEPGTVYEYIDGTDGGECGGNGGFVVDVERKAGHFRRSWET